MFCCLFLDNRHRLIAFDELFRGTIDGASVHPREVLRQAQWLHNAAAVILAHNHPSGVAEPSQADELITHRLRDALALVDIRVLDHLIICQRFRVRSPSSENVLYLRLSGQGGGERIRSTGPGDQRPEVADTRWRWYKDRPLPRADCGLATTTC